MWRMRSLAARLSACAWMLVSSCVFIDDFDELRIARDAAVDASDGEVHDGGGPDARDDADTPDGDAGELPDGGCATACSDNHYCAPTGTCEPKRPKGEDCGAAEECLSSFCDPDGICCEPGKDCCDSDAECAGLYRCDVGARECFEGCTVLDEATACKADGFCSGGGNCVADLAPGAGNACTRDGMCAGNQRCLDGYCCDAACGGCSACNRAGALGVCGPVPNNSDPHGFCAASGCTNTGNCNGMGGCQVVPAGTDPNGVCQPAGCANTGNCDGAGACQRVPNGAPPATAGSCGGACVVNTCNGGGGCTPRADGTSCGGGNCGSARCGGGWCQEFCEYSGQPACDYCTGDDAWICGGC